MFSRIWPVITLLVMGLVLIGPQMALGEVVVQSLAGEIAEDETVTINGHGFGLKVPAAPLKYDNFQNGEVGETLERGNPAWNLWSNIQPSGDAEAHYPKYSDAYARFQGDVTARQWYGPTPDGYIYNCTIGLRNLEIGKLYVSGWVWNLRPESGPEFGARNVKIFMNCVGVLGAPTTRYDCYPMYNEGSGHIYTEGCGTDVLSDRWGAGMPSTESWHRLEIYHDRGANDRDEYMAAYLNNHLIREISNAYSGCDQDRLYLMSYHDQYEGNAATLEWYWGEIYVDITQARIEIGDASTLAACTRKEIQIPETWNDETITFTVNKGAFQPDEELFLFVVDDEGNVNSEGFPLVMGGDFSGPEEPGTPGQPIRQ